MAERLRRPFMATAAARQLADIAVSPAQAFYREVATSTLRCECVKQSLRLLQIARIEAFLKPAVDRSEKLASLLPFTLIAPEPRHAHCRAQFPGLCLLRSGDCERTLKIRLRFRRVTLRRLERRFTGNAIDFGLPPWLFRPLSAPRQCSSTHRPIGRVPHALASDRTKMSL
jgi:hypothetical protein